jgi:hypothetical protein
VKCLSCGKEIVIEPPCFIQLCEECLREIKWGGEDGELG